MRVPFLELNTIQDSIREEMANAFDTVYRSGQYVLGPEVRRFEKGFAEYTNAKYAIGVSSGLDALFLCLTALEVKAGDEVIVPSNSYIAAALAVSQAGATPVFVEPDKETFNLDPNRLEAAITERTKAVIAVHMFGQACNMEAIKSIADLHGLRVIEDNAQAHGASQLGKPTGSWGIVNATSFYPTKNLGALGDAGCVTTDNFDLAESIRVLRNYGSIEKNTITKIGFNNRLDELQAAFLSVKLRHMDEWIKMRQSAAGLYFKLLANVQEIELPSTAASATHVYHLFVIKTRERNRLAKFLASNGIETSIHYPIPPHLQKAYAHLGLKKGTFPITEEIADVSLSLPIYPGITDDQVAYVAMNIRKHFSA
jgi:dTDP-4-amino-4,6-dideoxygalactose transaminase